MRVRGHEDVRCVLLEVAAAAGQRLSGPEELAQIVTVPLAVTDDDRPGWASDGRSHGALSRSAMTVGSSTPVSNSTDQERPDSAPPLPPRFRSASHRSRSRQVKHIFRKSGCRSVSAHGPSVLPHLVRRPSPTCQPDLTTVVLPPRVVCRSIDTRPIGRLPRLAPGDGATCVRHTGHMSARGHRWRLRFQGRAADFPHNAAVSPMCQVARRYWSGSARSHSRLPPIRMGPSIFGLGVRAVGRRGDGREAGATLVRVSRGPCGS